MSKKGGSKSDLHSIIQSLQKSLDNSFNRIDQLNEEIQTLKKKARIVITIEGALIQSIVSDRPVEVLKIDLDIDDLGEGDKTRKVYNNDGKQIEIYAYTRPIEEAEVDPEYVARYFRQFPGRRQNDDEQDSESDVG